MKLRPSCPLRYAHHANGESQFGLGETWSRALHVAIGYPVLLWTVAQAGSGALKARALEPADPEAEPARKYTWHGASGKWCLVGGYVAIGLGYWLQMNARSGLFWVSSLGWGVAIKAPLTALTLALVAFRTLPPKREGDEPSRLTALLEYPLQYLQPV